MSRVATDVLIAAAVLMGVPVAGCGRDGEGGATGFRAPPTPGATGSGVAVIPAGQLAAALNDASDYQRAVIEDGQVTFEEYERAVLDTVACYQGNGLQVMSAPYLAGPPREGLILLAGDRYMFFAGAAGRELSAQEWERAQVCDASFSRVVSAMWIGGVGPTLQELEAARAEVAECLLGEGVGSVASPGASRVAATRLPARWEAEWTRNRPGLPGVRRTDRDQAWDSRLWGGILMAGLAARRADEGYPALAGDGIPGIGAP